MESTEELKRTWEEREKMARLHQIERGEIPESKRERENRLSEEAYREVFGSDFSSPKKPKSVGLVRTSYYDSDKPEEGPETLQELWRKRDHQAQGLPNPVSRKELEEVWAQREKEARKYRESHMGT